MSHLSGTGHGNIGSRVLKSPHIMQVPTLPDQNAQPAHPRTQAGAWQPRTPLYAYTAALAANARESLGAERWSALPRLGTGPWPRSPVQPRLIASPLGPSHPTQSGHLEPLGAVEQQRPGPHQ